MNQNIKKTDSLDSSSSIAKHNHNLLKPIFILTCQLLIALPLSLAISKLNLGGMAWIFGGMFAGVIVLQLARVAYQIVLPPNRKARHVGLMLVGLSIGFSMTQSNFISVAKGIPVFVFLTFFLLVSGSIIGYFYSRFTQTNLLTSMLATVPGGVGVMSAIAADYNKNVTLVALVQVIRVTSVVVLIPLIARIFANYGIIQSPEISASKLALESYLGISNIGLLILVASLSIIAVTFFLLLRIPAAHFFATLMVGMLFHPIITQLPMMADIELNLPPAVGILGQILLGITIGEYWGKDTTFQTRTIAYAIISTFMTLLAGAIASLMAMQLTSWDWLTCMLVTAPGGAAEMILVALTLNHDVEIVTIGHLVRLIAINSSLPIWIFLFRRLDTQVSKPV